MMLEAQIMVIGVSLHNIRYEADKNYKKRAGIVIFN